MPEVPNLKQYIERLSGGNKADGEVFEAQWNILMLPSQHMHKFSVTGGASYSELQTVYYPQLETYVTEFMADNPQANQDAVVSQGIEEILVPVVWNIDVLLKSMTAQIRQLVQAQDGGGGGGTTAQ